MKAKKKSRAPRGVPHLDLNRAGVWCIVWPRDMARIANLPRLQSLGTCDREVAERMLRRRHAEVNEQIGRPEKAAEIRSEIQAIPIDQLVADFLRALKIGLCPPTPKQRTIDDVYIPALLGSKDGFVKFACDLGRLVSTQIDVNFAERWLDAGRLRGLAGDSLRLRLVVLRRLSKWACSEGYLSQGATNAIAAIKRPKGAKGRAKADDVPAWGEIQQVLLAMSPPYWRSIAECQCRLGLRRGEVLTLSADWIDERKGEITVKITEDFAPKSNHERRIPSDPETLKLAKEVAAIRTKKKLTATGYRMAWERAIAKIQKTGVKWDYRAKSHSLRQFYATESIACGIPLVAVADRLGHGSVKVTEAHYLGRISKRTATPFAGVASLSLPSAPTSPSFAANDNKVAANG